jgi:hypothetical protein
MCSIEGEFWAIDRLGIGYIKSSKLVTITTESPVFVLKNWACAIAAT